jgi:2-aminoadipate transaminase
MRSARREYKAQRSRELLKISERPEVIPFAGGLPAAEVFPVERFQAACHTVLQRIGSSALQYGATEGYEPLREMVAGHINRYGIRAKTKNVLITSGSQQALDLLGKLLINNVARGCRQPRVAAFSA